MAITEIAGARTFLAVPMLKENRLVGAIGIYRQEVRPFTDKQIELVENFASQAVIAIENARLLNEIQDKNRQLQMASERKSQFLASPGKFDDLPCDARYTRAARSSTNAVCESLMAAALWPPKS